MKAIEYWEKKLRRKSKGTQREYRRRFNGFLEWADLDSEQLYVMQRQALGAADLRESDAVMDLVGDYLHHLKDEGYSNSVCNQTLSSLRSFFEANKLEFNTRELRLRPIYRGARRVLKNEILEIYRYCQRDQKWRNRALVMVAKDSGLRASDLAQLKIQQINSAKEVWNRGERFLVLEPFRTVKTGDTAHTVLGPESLDAIIKYIGNRRGGPLFLDRNENGMDSDAMIAQFLRFNNALDDAGQSISAHSFRKFFKTMMEAVMPEPWVKMLMGKSVGPYTCPTKDELARAYIKGYDQLRIFTVGIDREEFDSMKKELESLRSMVVTRLERYKIREEHKGSETIEE